MNKAVQLNIQNTVKGKLALVMATAAVLAVAACSAIPEKKVAALPKVTQKAPTQVLKQVWGETVAGANEKDPLRLVMDLDDDRVIAAGRDGVVIAWNKQGKQLWKTPLNSEVVGGVAVQNRIAVVTLKSGMMLALDANNGKTIWKKQLSATVQAPVLIQAERVIAMANDGSVTAVELANGQLSWGFDVATPSLGLRGGVSPVLFTEDLAVVSTNSGRLFGLDVVTGIPVFEARVANSTGKKEDERIIDIDAEPLVSGRMMYVGSYQGQLVAFNVERQQVIWAVKASIAKRLAEGSGNVYAATTTGDVLAVNQRTGQASWSTDLLKGRELSNPIAFDKYIVVGDQDGYLHIFDQITGQYIGRERASGPVNELREQNNQIVVNAANGKNSIWTYN